LLDQAGRRIVLQGTIADQPALLLAERAAFDADESHLSTFSSSLSHIKNLGDNDIYRWYMAHSGAAQGQPPDLKINLMYPCTEQHLKKYAAQAVRYVTETPDIYRDHVRPYMQAKRDQGRLNWVFNILDGRTEQEDVLFRSPHNTTPEDERYLLLPDLNWDRKTLGSLHLLALVERRDIWSLRDLKKKHVTWLKSIVADIANNVSSLYGIDEDMLKCYVHCMSLFVFCLLHCSDHTALLDQPTYYHFHIHIVHVSLEAGATQAVGKALSLDNIISQLATMAGDDEAGMDKVDLSFTLGEASELWTDVFLPLKEKRLQ
jgi:m7GpppX diphosphatase